MTDLAVIRLLLVVDHFLVRQELAAFLDIQEGLKVVGQTDNGAEALELLSKLKPDVVVIDLKLPGMDGVATGQAILRQSASTRVVLLTNLEDEERYVEALRTKAFVCLPKYGGRDLLKAIRSDADYDLVGDRKGM
ncbi:MAG: response regulator transcription factor [Anaerolineaceae bacterium]|nr:response regulator transcription factor [Anaerolineaceae bacterium]